MAPKHKSHDTGELMVSIAQYTKTRDAVIVALSNLQSGLTNVQSGISELLQAYMQHTASILAGEDGNLDRLRIPSTIAATASAAIEAATTAANGVSQTLDPAFAVLGPLGGKGRKRKRERKEKDPNAPKRPLTAYFLYQKSARPIVELDLQKALGEGEVLEKHAVSLEMVKRWKEMPVDEKAQWGASYRDSLDEYKAKMAEYTGTKVVDVHEDDEGSDEEHADLEAEMDAADSDALSDDEDDASSVAKVPSPPAKTPRKRQKSTQAATMNGNPSAVPVAPVMSSATPVPPPRSRASAAAAATAAATPKAPSPNPLPEAPATVGEKKDRKKKERGAPPPLASTPAAPPLVKERSETKEEELGGKKKSKNRSSARNAEAEDDTMNGKVRKAKLGKEKKKERKKGKSEASAV